MQNILLKVDRQMTLQFIAHANAIQPSCCIHIKREAHTHTHIVNSERNKKREREQIIDMGSDHIKPIYQFTKIKSATQIDTNSVSLQRPCLSSACKWTLWRLQNNVRSIHITIYNRATDSKFVQN